MHTHIPREAAPTWQHLGHGMHSCICAATRPCSGLTVAPLLSCLCCVQTCCCCCRRCAALTFFFANFGPNSTTFIIPGEAFPTRCVGCCFFSMCTRLDILLGLSPRPVHRLYKGSGRTALSHGTDCTPAVLILWLGVLSASKGPSSLRAACVCVAVFSVLTPPHTHTHTHNHTHSGYRGRYRSTCHGLSAASGKAGAILGVFAFGYLKVRGSEVTAASRRAQAVTAASRQ